MFLHIKLIILSWYKLQKSLTRLQLFQHPHYLLNEFQEYYLQPGISGVEGALICTREDEFNLPEVSITGNNWSGFSGMPTKHIFPFVLSTLRYGSSGCWAETVSMMKSIDFAAAYAHDGKRNHQDSAIPFRGRLTKNWLSNLRILYLDTSQSPIIQQFNKVSKIRDKAHSTQFPTLVLYC